MLATTLQRVLGDGGIRSDEYRAFPKARGRIYRMQHLEIPLMTWALQLPRRVRVLEVGCGRGYGLRRFARLLTPTHLVGLDINPDLLGEAATLLRAKRIDAELVCGDVRDMPFADGSFDVVVDFGTCYHIASANRALWEVYRVLSAGGLFVSETRIAQMISHPVRSLSRALPLRSAAALRQARWAMMWSARRKPSLA